jgi:CubicO group peptidase (beta-lactamase class C family)
MLAARRFALCFPAAALLVTYAAAQTPDDAEARARALVNLPVQVQTFVFEGSAFPAVTVGDVGNKTLGQHTIKTTFYDRTYRQVISADSPGPYAAVVEITTNSGRTVRRYLTLFRGPDGTTFDGKATAADVARFAGCDAKVAEQHKAVLAATLRDRPFAELAKDARVARLLAGLHVSKATSDGVTKLTDAFAQERQWWVTLKRKLTGLDKEFAKPFECPRPIPGIGATVVHEGTLAEAGFKEGSALKLDAILTEWAANDDQAFAVCIVRKGVIVLHKAYGTRDGQLMTVDTKSWMASITKTMSATLMMMLVDQGLVRLDDPLDKFIPALRGQKVPTPVTVRHCYTHTAGMNAFPNYNDELADFEERVADYYPRLHVGEDWAYNAASYSLAGKAIEAVSGEALPLFYQKHLFGPLGCTGTEVIGTHADAVSIPLDMAKFGQLLLNQGSYGSHRFFGPETFRMMLPHKLTAELGPNARRTFGIGLDGTPDRIGHGAASAATFSVDRGEQLIVVMTRNKMGKNQDRYNGKFHDALRAAMLRDSDTEVAAALKKSAALENYAFTVEQLSGMAGAVEAKYAKGQPLWATADKVECYKQGDKMVYLDAGKWQRTKSGTESDPLRVLGAIAKVRTLRLPHEELAALEKHLRDVKKAADPEDGLTVYTADLTPDGAKALATEHKDVARGGTVKLWAGKDGVMKYTVSIRVQGKVGNAEIDGTLARTTTLRQLGATKVEVPDAARKALE